jgi:hypothetical protein
MGAAAIVSAILSCFIDTRQIAQLQELLHMKIDHDDEPSSDSTKQRQNLTPPEERNSAIGDT